MITNIFSYFIYHLRLETDSYRYFLNQTNRELIGEVSKFKIDNEPLFEFTELDLLNPDNLYRVRGKIEENRIAKEPELTLKEFLEGKVIKRKDSDSASGLFS